MSASHTVHACSAAHALPTTLVLAVLHTGGGKSLCFQIPGLLRPDKLTVVVSPLVSLMADQAPRSPHVTKP